MHDASNPVNFVDYQGHLFSPLLIIQWNTEHHTKYWYYCLKLDLGLDYYVFLINQRKMCVFNMLFSISNLVVG